MEDSWKEQYLEAQRPAQEDSIPPENLPISLVGRQKFQPKISAFLTASEMRALHTIAENERGTKRENSSNPDLAGTRRTEPDDDGGRIDALVEGGLEDCGSQEHHLEIPPVLPSVDQICQTEVGDQRLRDVCSVQQNVPPGTWGGAPSTPSTPLLQHKNTPLYTNP